MSVVGRSLRIHTLSWSTAVVVTGALVLATWCVSPGAGAEPLYTYTKEDGSVVVTNDVKRVPERYRSRVKTFESQPARPQARSARLAQAGKSLASTAREEASRLMDLLPDFKSGGRTKYQSFVLAMGLAGSVFAFAVMVMSQNPGMRFAMKWVLMFLVVGMVYTLYFSELTTYDVEHSGDRGSSSRQEQSLMQRMKIMGKKVEKNQQEHADELNQLDQP